MKLPFSYKSKNNLFSIILFASLFGHSLAFTVCQFSSPLPKYSVMHGVSSIEINILEELKELPKAPEDVLVAKNPEEVKETVRQETQEKEPARIESKPARSQAFDGALNENLPDYLRNPAPIYPLMAREKSWEGLVLLRSVINKDGNVEELSIEQSSGYSILDQSALKTIRTWKFRPAQLAQFKFSSTIKIPVRFVLTDEKK